MLKVYNIKTAMTNRVSIKKGTRPKADALLISYVNGALVHPSHAAAHSTWHSRHSRFILFRDIGDQSFCS